MAAIKEHERVILTKTMPDDRLEAGDVGTVVHMYRDGSAHEVEFTTLDGWTAAVVTVEASDVRPVSRHEITHARTLGELAGHERVEPAHERQLAELKDIMKWRRTAGIGVAEHCGISQDQFRQSTQCS